MYEQEQQQVTDRLIGNLRRGQQIQQTNAQAFGDAALLTLSNGLDVTQAQRILFQVADVVQQRQHETEQTTQQGAMSGIGSSGTGWTPPTIQR